MTPVSSDHTRSGCVLPAGKSETVSGLKDGLLVATATYAPSGVEATADGEYPDG